MKRFRFIKEKAAWVAAIILWGGVPRLPAQTLQLPPRPADAPSGSELNRILAPLSQADREARIISEITRGNVPDFLRQLSPVTGATIDGEFNGFTYFVTPDYLAVGRDDDYCLTPLTPLAAQTVADRCGCLLPTRRMVGQIHAAAKLKLPPLPIPPSAAMTTWPVFAQHDAMIHTQRNSMITLFPAGTLVAGHKKDVVLTPRLATAPGKVAIYGWHQTNRTAIQPLYLGHTDAWVDYSHGIRLVQGMARINGVSMPITNILRDLKLAWLISDEGVINNARYAPSPSSPDVPVKASPAPSIEVPSLQPNAQFNEQTCTFTLAPDARFHINAPSATAMSSGKKLKLVFYALPNGNTIEQTIGKQLKPGDDWHFDIQHIGAQMRYLRELCPDSNWVVVYLEAAGKSWPAWRKQHDSQLIPAWIDAIKQSFNTTNVSVTLSGHSGGGSAIFGYINSISDIPAEVERITFLDSNYAYDETAGHTEKLTRWLRASGQHYLSVLAYHDDIALLDGKTFVSASGGTWGRSHLMKKNFPFPFGEDITPEFQRFTALEGRVKFILKENLEKAVLHTVQVERNGFIQSMVSGTPEEGKGYAYFGPRAYGKWITEK